MNLPLKAVIVANTKEELTDLMMFFDMHGFLWLSGRTCCSVIDIIWNNKNVKEHGDNVAINISCGFPEGFCWPNYYKIHEKEYFNDDPKWNFISVEDFIKELGESPMRLEVDDLL